MQWCCESIVSGEVDGEGTQRWCVDELPHRDGGLPAVVYANGHQEWWVNGKLHRDGGLLAVVYANGHQEWWVHGKVHRDGDLPAVVYADGSQEWWVHGKVHRDGGLPAVVYADGHQAWWVHGKMVTEQQYAMAVRVVRHSMQRRKYARFHRLCHTAPYNGHQTSYHLLRKKWDDCKVKQWAKTIEEQGMMINRERKGADEDRGR